MYSKTSKGFSASCCEWPTVGFRIRNTPNSTLRCTSPFLERLTLRHHDPPYFRYRHSVATRAAYRMPTMNCIQCAACTYLWSRGEERSEDERWFTDTIASSSRLRLLVFLLPPWAPPPHEESLTRREYTSHQPLRPGGPVGWARPGGDKSIND